jgi:hypothetical protein
MNMVMAMLGNHQQKYGPVTGPENSASPQAMMNVIEYLLVF